jgi:RNA polymerase sigma-70 factor, ECF subfamily
MSQKQEHFMSLLDPVHDDIVRYIRAMTRDDEATRDIFGETLLIAYESIDTLRDPGAFKFFLITIARRAFSQAVWKRRIYTGVDRRILEAFWDPAPLPDRDADVALLYDMLQRLPLKQREAIVLFALHGHSLEEIKNIQGGTLSGVKARVARARRKLEELFRDRESVPRQTPLHRVITEEAEA